MLEVNCQKNGTAEVNLNKENDTSTVNDIYNIYDIVNDNTSVKKINIKYKVPDYPQNNDNNNDLDSEYSTKISEDMENMIKKYGYQIFIKTLSGRTLTIQVCSQLDVESLKKLIEQKEHIPVAQQRLIFNGMQLEDSRMLSYYKINKEVSIHLVLRLRGGMYNETSGKNGGFGALKDIKFSIDADVVVALDSESKSIV
mgnify:FL=1